MQFLYGKGIAEYIQDIDGTGLDMVANPEKPRPMQALPVMSVDRRIAVRVRSEVARNGRLQRRKGFRRA